MKESKLKICIIFERFTLEKWFYFSIWVGAVSYGIYYFTKRSNEFFSTYTDTYGDFEEGTLINRKRDSSDAEFEDITYILQHYGPFMLANLIILEIQRKFITNKDILKLTQIFISSLGVIEICGFKSFLIILSQPLLYTTVAFYFKNKKALYMFLIFNMSWMHLLPCYKLYIGLSMLTYIAYGWSILKCSYFYFENNDVTKRRFIDLLEYVFYLPTFHMGPFLMHSIYEEKYCFEKYKPLAERILRLLENGLRVLFWYVVMYVSLHYVYVGAMKYQEQELYTFDSTSLYGFGFLMGVHFQLKYVLLYGIGTLFSSFCNIPVPPLPRCIGRTHLYSDMWRFFDVGLYQYLVKVIYKPSLFSPTFLNKLFSGALTFAFIWVWHGMRKKTFYWAIMNFFSVLVESIGKELCKTEPVKKLEKTIGQFYFQKLKHVLIGCLMILNSISNFHFLGSVGIAQVYFDRIYRDPVQKTVTLIFILFSLSEFADIIRDVPAAVM